MRAVHSTVAVSFRSEIDAARKMEIYLHNGLGLSPEYSLQLCGDWRWCCNNQSVSTCCNDGSSHFAFNLLSLGHSPTTVTTAVVTLTVTDQVQQTSNGGSASTKYQ